MPSNASPVLFSWEFDGKGGGKALEGEAVSKQLKAKKLAWVHLNALHPHTRDWLRQEVGYLDELVLDALLAEETRPRMTEIEDGMLLILRGMNLNEGAEPEDMVSVRLWVDAHRIITLERRPLRAVADVLEHLHNERGPKDSGEFLTQLSALLAERMQPVLTELDEQVDAAEERVMQEPDITQREAIVDIRQQAIIFRRYISPQRDVMQYLRNSMMKWMGPNHKRHAQEVYDRLQRYVEDLDAIRERAQIVKDELATTLSDRLNHNLYVLSVIAAIFLPLGFLTGMFGINIGGMPGVEDPNAFWIFAAALVVIVALQVWLFKKLRWF